MSTPVMSLHRVTITFVGPSIAGNQVLAFTVACRWQAESTQTVAMSAVIVVALHARTAAANSS